LNSGQVSKSKFVKKIEVMMKVYFDAFDVKKLVIKTIENFASNFKSGKVMDKYLPVLVAWLCKPIPCFQQKTSYSLCLCSMHPKPFSSFRCTKYFQRVTIISK